MRTVTTDIQYTSSSAAFKIWPIGDAHLGNVACDETKLKKDVQEIKEDPNSFWFAAGDINDCIGRNLGDGRASEDTLAKWLHGQKRLFDIQREYAIDMLSPIGDKCLGFIMGNHEGYALDHFGVDHYLSIANALCPDRDIRLGYGGFMRLRFRRVHEGDAPIDTKRRGQRCITYTMYATHGYGGGRKIGAKAQRLVDLTATYEADIYWMAHVHGELATGGVRIRTNSGGAIEERRWKASITGTYLRGWHPEAITYPERMCLAPNAVESPICVIKPEVGEIKIIV